MTGRYRYSEEECLERLRKAAAECGEAPTMDQYDSLNLKPSAQVVADRCGGWEEALRKIDAERSPNREYTEEECLDAIQMLAGAIDREPTVTDYEESSLLPSLTTIQNICGSWTEAKEMAGVTGLPERAPEMEADDFFSQLERAQREDE